MQKSIVTYNEVVELSDSIMLNYCSKAPQISNYKNKILKELIFGDFFDVLEINLPSMEQALENKARRAFEKYIMIVSQNNYIQKKHENSEWIGEEELRIEYISEYYLIVSITDYYCLGADRGKSSEYHVTKIRYKVFDLVKMKLIEINDILDSSINWTELIISMTDKTIFRIGNYKGLKMQVNYKKHCVIKDIHSPDSFSFDNEKMYFFYSAKELIGGEKVSL